MVDRCMGRDVWWQGRMHKPHTGGFWVFAFQQCICVHLVFIALFALIALIPLCQLCSSVTLRMPRLALGNSRLADHVHLLKPQPAVVFILSGLWLVASLCSSAEHQHRASGVTEGGGRAQPDSCLSPSTMLLSQSFGAVVMIGPNTEQGFSVAGFVLMSMFQYDCCRQTLFMTRWGSTPQTLLSLHCHGHCVERRTRAAYFPAGVLLCDWSLLCLETFEQTDR